MCVIAVRPAGSSAGFVPKTRQGAVLSENFEYEQELRENASEPMFNVPGVIVALIGSFIVVHLIQVMAGRQVYEWILLRFAFTGARIIPAPELQGMVLPGGPGATVWTFFTHMFLHGSWMHLIFNSVWMLAFGSVVARRFGTVRFLLFSLVMAALGATASLFAHWGHFSLMVGASGAISGQMAGAVRLMYSVPGGLANLQHGGDFTQIRVLPLSQLLRIKGALLFIAVWVVTNMVFGISGFGTGGGVDSIAWEAHLGGFFGGLLLFSLFDRAQRHPVSYL